MALCRVNMPAILAGTLVAFDWAIRLQLGTTATMSQMLQIVNLIEITTAVTHYDMAGMSYILGNKIAGEEIYFLRTGGAIPCLDP